MEVTKGFVTRVNSFKFYLYILPVANMAGELKWKGLVVYQLLVRIFD